MSQARRSRKVRTRVRVLRGVAAATMVLAALAPTASASSAPIEVTFEKHSVGSGHYVGTTGDGGTIEMQVSNSSVTGNMQHFDVTIWATVDGGSLTAEARGTFNFKTLETVLNGTVVSGWLEGARLHEQGNLTSFDPLTFTGTLMLLPAS